MAKDESVVKSFEDMRNTLKQLYIYGHDVGIDADELATMSLYKKYARAEKWLELYMTTDEVARKHDKSVTIDSKNQVHNPFYDAIKNKSIGHATKLLLFFMIMDNIDEKNFIKKSEVVAKVRWEFSSDSTEEPNSEESDSKKSNKKKAIGDKSVSYYLDEFEQLGLLEKAESGVARFKKPTDSVDITKIRDFAFFMSETDPLGLVGSYILDRDNIKYGMDAMSKDNWVRFKHHFLLYALDSEIIDCVLTAIKNKQSVICKKNDSTIEIVPVKLLLSSVGGRGYILGFDRTEKGISSYRIDQISSAKLGSDVEDWDSFYMKYEESSPYRWGVSVSEPKNRTHVEVTFKIEEKDLSTLDRLDREKRNGVIEKIDDTTYIYKVDTYDAAELAPWLKTYLGRIVEIKCDEHRLSDRYSADVDEMYEMYLGGE